MELTEVPAGFGMALIQNPEATNAFAMMTKEQKQAIWKRARNARSEKEMQQIVNSISAN